MNQKPQPSPRARARNPVSTTLRLRMLLLLVCSLVMMGAAVASGFAGHGAAGLLTVIVAFAFARVLNKPWLIKGIKQNGGLHQLSQELVGQLVLAVLLWSLGIVGSMLAGGHGALPLAQPATVIVVAAVAQRMIWRPLPPELEDFTPERLAERQAEDEKARLAAIERGEVRLSQLEEELDAFPEALPEPEQHAALLAILASAEADLGPASVLNCLSARAKRPGTPRDLALLMEYSFRSPLAAHTIALPTLFRQLDAQGNSTLMRHFAEQSLSALHSEPAVAQNLPSAAALTQACTDLEDDTQEALQRLAAALPPPPPQKAKRNR